VQVVLAPGPLVVQLELEVELAPRSAAIVWISCVTTRNSSSCDRWYNSNRKCSSPSCNRLVPETLSWLK